MPKSVLRRILLDCYVVKQVLLQLTTVLNQTQMCMLLGCCGEYIIYYIYYFNIKRSFQCEMKYFGDILINILLIINYLMANTFIFYTVDRAFKFYCIKPVWLHLIIELKKKHSLKSMWLLFCLFEVRPGVNRVLYIFRVYMYKTSKAFDKDDMLHIA